MNYNCLEGIQCPECGNERSFHIEAKALFQVYDNGTADYEEVQWEDNSYIACDQCTCSGKVGDFRVKEPLVELAEACERVTKEKENAKRRPKGSHRADHR